MRGRTKPGLMWLHSISLTDHPKAGRHKYPTRALSSWKAMRVGRNALVRGIVSEIFELRRQRDNT